MMRTETCVLIMLCVAALWMTACDDIVLEDNDRVDEQPFDDDDDAGDDDSGDDDDAVDEPTYDNFAEVFFADYCTRCHQTPPQNGAPFSLDGYNAVASRLADIKRTTVTSSFMPLSAPLPTDTERDRLGIWIDAGGPRN